MPLGYKHSINKSTLNCNCVFHTVCYIITTMTLGDGLVQQITYLVRSALPRVVLLTMLVKPIPYFSSL